MDRIYLLPEKGSFYKANLHAHTTLSDGSWTPQELKRKYMDRGYSIVAYTDHRKYLYHKELCDSDFVALAAFEADVNLPESQCRSWNMMPVYHLNFYDTEPEGRKEIPEMLENRYDREHINGYIQKLAGMGFLCCYNHPWWSLQAQPDYTALKGLAAMEIYNNGCEIDGLYGYAAQAYDEMLRSGQRIGCFATDDNHDRSPENTRAFDSFGGFTFIKAEGLTYESIVSALKSGDYYASTGPEIKELYIEDGCVHITCSPVEKIYMINAGRNCEYTLSEPGKTITRAKLPLAGADDYIRIDCRDGSGCHAYSRAYFLDELGL